MLPQVIKRFNDIIFAKDLINQIQDELTTDPRYLSGFKEYMIKKQELNAALSNFYKSIENLENMGVMIKSIDEGLLDFPSLRFNEEIWLCWKKGESEIKFWHGKDEGFMGRKPLTVSDESLI